MITTIFYAIGALVSARFAIQAVNALIAIFFRAPKDLRTMGKWGIVTGATDGIGKALALELAQKGLNVLLISRTQEKLDEVKKCIESTHKGVQVQTLQCDFGKFDQGARRKVRECVSSIDDVAVLFNNVGASYDFPQYFTELTEGNLDYLIKLNVDSTTFMTHIVLPGMVARKRGAIVNMSSGSASISAPLLAQYSAAKRYIEQLTESLAPEYRSKGVHVQCHSPMFVTTKLAKIRNPTFFIPTPETYAKAAVANVGYETLCSPYWPHALQLFIYQHIPNFILSRIALSMHIGLRKRALKKQEEKAKLN